MKKLFVLLLILSFFSCNYFNAKKISSEDILSEELKTFTWNEVDAYPIFESCDSTLSQVESKLCFQQVLTDSISHYLYKNEIVVSSSINSTINLDFEVSDRGYLSLINIEQDSLISAEIPQLDSLLYKSIESLPKIYPALKRGQQVTTKFRLPILVKVAEN